MCMQEIMDENMKKRNEILAKTVIKGLESRNMSGYYAADKEAAVKQALELIQNLMPEYEVIGVYARDIIVGGGNIHCITQQIPQ